MALCCGKLGPNLREGLLQFNTTCDEIFLSREDTMLPSDMMSTEIM